MQVDVKNIPALPRISPASALLHAEIVNVNIDLQLAMQQISGLINSIRHTISGVAVPVVHFACAYEDEGAETIAFQVAAASAFSGKRVLLIDASAGQRSLREQIPGKPVPSLTRFISHSEVESPFLMAQGTSLYFSGLGEASGDDLLLPDEIAIRSLMDQLRMNFDLIVIESEGALKQPGAAALSGAADATVLVVQAERTRMPVLRELQRMLESHGGKIVGTVLNKRRFYIPRFLYPIFFRR
ncbi:MAG: ATPase involved in chromosome partitioning-like [Micavibrio sp.]|nr:ATPase involved in chromosome partitioning-like [Micavibrio sp.]